MRFNLNVNLESIEDLLKVANALKEAATLQAQLRLQESIKELKAEKFTLRAEIKELRDEHTKAKEPEEGAIKKPSEAEEDKEEAEVEDYRPPSGLNEQADRIIERIDETNPHEEAEQR